MAFGNASERLAFVLQLDAAGAIRGFNQLGDSADRNLGAVDNRLDRLGGRMQVAGAGAVAFAGIAGRALYGFAQASEDANLAQVKLQNSIENSPELAGETADRFLDLADAIQSVTAADGDQIVAAEAMLGTFHLTGDEIERVTPLVVDYARKFDVDLVSAATQVGKALSGNIATLQRNGIVIDENAYATDRFNAVTSALRENVGGFAEQEGATFAGQMARLKNELGDVAEGIGVGVVSAFTDLLGPVRAVSDAFTELDPQTQSLIGRVGTFGVAAIGFAGGASLVVGSLIKMRTNLTVAADGLRGFTSRVGGVGSVLGVAGAAVGVFGAVMAASANRQEKAQAIVDDYTQAIEKQTGALEDNVDAVTAKAFADSGLAGDVQRAGGDLETFAGIVRDGGADLERFADVAVDLATVYAGDIPEALDAAGLATTDLGRELIRLADAGEINQHEFADVIHMLGNLRTGYVDSTNAAKDKATADEALGTAADGATGSTDDLTEATDENAEATKTAAEREERLNRALEERKRREDEIYGAVTSLFEAERAHRDAQRESITALNELDQITRDHGDSSWEAREAVDRTAEAMDNQAQRAVELFEQTAILNGETLTAEQKATIHRQALEKIAETLEPGSPLRKQLDTYIWQLATIPSQIETELILNTGAIPGSIIGGILGGPGGGVLGGILGSAGAAAGDAKSIPSTAPVNVIVNAYGRLTTEEYAAAREAGRAAGREALNELGVRVN